MCLESHFAIDSPGSSANISASNKSRIARRSTATEPTNAQPSALSSLRAQVNSRYLFTRLCECCMLENKTIK